MTFTFYVVDEKHFGPEVTTAGAIHDLLQRHGADWGSAEAGESELVAMFRILDGVARTRTLLATLALRGSPRHVLLASLEPWRLGYFEAHMVPLVNTVLRVQAARISAAMAERGDTAELLHYRFAATLDEARSRAAAVAIRHRA